MMDAVNDTNRTNRIEQVRREWREVKEDKKIYSWEDLKREMKERDDAKGIKKIWYNIEDSYHWCWNRLDDLRDIPRRIKAFWQRGTRGWADRDTWQLGGYIAKVISESVLCLEKTNSGYPGGLTKAKWNKILMDVSRGFALVEKEANCEVYSLRGTPKKKREEVIKEVDTPYFSEDEEKQMKDAWKLLQEWLTGMWD